MTVLLSESASLTARETLTVLGRRHVEVDVLSSGRLTLGRFSRWASRTITTPPAGEDPIGYLGAVSDLLASGRYEALLPTHEQAWLFAAGRHLLPPDAPIAVAPVSAFDRVQGKVDFAELLDELAIPQPQWWRCEDRPADVPYPHWVKASHGNSGRTVRKVDDVDAEQRAVAAFGGPGTQLMGQAPAPGQYGQVQALFDRGRLVAVHTSVQLGEGAGGSAAARLSVDHPEPRRHIARIGEYLGWHGGLTLDYLHVDGQPQYIEANARTVEPGNAALAGVDMPSLTTALSTGAKLPDTVVTGRAGVRSRSALALAIGAAERDRRRSSVVATLARCALRRGQVGSATEVLTPIWRDPLSAIPLAVVVSQLLVAPARAGALASGASARYGLSPAAIDVVRQIN